MITYLTWNYIIPRFYLCANSSTFPPFKPIDAHLYHPSLETKNQQSPWLWEKKQSAFFEWEMSLIIFRGIMGIFFLRPGGKLIRHLEQRKDERRGMEGSYWLASPVGFAIYTTGAPNVIHMMVRSRGDEKPPPTLQKKVSLKCRSTFDLGRRNYVEMR